MTSLSAYEDHVCRDIVLPEYKRYQMTMEVSFVPCPGAFRALYMSTSKEAKGTCLTKSGGIGQIFLFGVDIKSSIAAIYDRCSR